MRSTIRFTLACALLALPGCKNELSYAPPGSLRCDVPGAICARGFDGTGDGGSLLGAGFIAPAAIARDPDGRLLVADTLGNRIRRVSADGAEIETIAGNGRASYVYSNGSDALEAPVTAPTSVAGTTDGWVFWTDAVTCVIRGLAPDGTVRTVAGSGVCTSSGGNTSPDMSLYLNSCAQLTADGENLYIPDTHAQRVRYWNRSAADVTIAGVTVPAGTVGTVAGNGSSGADTDEVAAIATNVTDPCHVTEGPDGETFYITQGAHRVRKVTPDGVIHAVVGNGTSASSGDFGPRTSAGVLSPNGSAVSADGNLIFVSEEGQRVRIANLTLQSQSWGPFTLSSGQILTIAGTGFPEYLLVDTGAGVAQSFRTPGAPLLDADGSLLLPDIGNHVLRRIDATTGDMRVVGGLAGADSIESWANAPAAIAFRGSEMLVTARTARVLSIDGGETVSLAGNGSAAFTADGVPATESGMWPLGIDAAPSGTIYFADPRNHRVRFVDPETGVVGTIAGTGEDYQQGDGGPAVNARFYGPMSVLSDADGNLFVTDENRIRFINNGVTSVTIFGIEVPPGNIAKVVGSDDGGGFGGDGGPAPEAYVALSGGTEYPVGMAIAGGYFYFADTNNHRIRRVSFETGVIDTVAGSGANSTTGVGTPVGVAVLDGYLYWTQLNGNMLRRMRLPAGPVETVAGGTGTGAYGDGIDARDAQFVSPQGLATDGDAIYVLDANHTVRRIQP